MTIAVTAGFLENNKYYLQVFFDERLYKMLYYDRTDVSEGIDVNKTSFNQISVTDVMIY